MQGNRCAEELFLSRLRITTVQFAVCMQGGRCAEELLLSPPPTHPPTLLCGWYSSVYLRVCVCDLCRLKRIKKSRSRTYNCSSAQRSRQWTCPRNGNYCYKYKFSFTKSFITSLHQQVRYALKFVFGRGLSPPKVQKMNFRLVQTLVISYPLTNMAKVYSKRNFVLTQCTAMCGHAK